MARRVLDLDVSAFEEAWLVKSELSLPLPEGKKRGLSFFFGDEEEFAAFLEAAGLPKSALEHERRLRDKFDLLGRYWLKLHYHESELKGFSQYFQTNPLVGYPITTLRLFLRMYGHGDVSRLEAMIEPALASRRTVYGLVLKHRGDTVIPRLSLRVDRRLLPELFSRFVQAGYLEPERAEAYLSWEGRIGASDFAFLSFEPGKPGACALDFEEVSASTLPVSCQKLSLPERLNFLKCRLRDDLSPEWTGYLMLSALRTGLEYHPDGSPREEEPNAYLEEIRRYYDRISPVAIEHLGPTYQAGLFSEMTPTASNLHLAARAGLKPGDHILDAGCGVCGPSIDIARAINVTIEAVTLSEVQAAEARRLICEARLEDGIRVQVGDYHELAFADETFDAVVFLESLGYAYDPAKLLANVYRMLRPGGKLYIKDVFRREGELSAQELQELTDFNRLYAFRTPTVESTVNLLVRFGFEHAQCHDLTERISMARFNRAMFANSPQLSLSAFGKRHYHTFTALPVRFWEVSAQKPSGN